MGRRQFPGKNVWEGISFPGRMCGQALVPWEGVERCQFPGKKVWEGASAPGRRYGKVWEGVIFQGRRCGRRNISR